MGSRFRTPKLILEYYSLASVTSDHETQISSSNRRLQKLGNNLPINYRESQYTARTGKMASELDLRTEREVTNQPGADEPPCTPGQGRSQSGHYLLLRWNDLPSWRQDNEYLLSGYRPSSGSFRKSLNSLQHIHNETVNIYSHLLGAALFATYQYLST